MADKLDETQINPENEGAEDTEEIPDVLNLLPLRDTVLFPAAVLPLNIGRESSVKLIDDTVTNSTNT